MQKQSLSLFIVLVSVFVILCAAIAGCASQTPPVPAVTPSATQQQLSTIEPLQMMLQPSDLPANFTLVETYERSASNVSDWGTVHGWKKGYGIYYETGGRDVRGLEQTISVYPVGNISLVLPNTVQQVNEWAAEEGNMTVEELPVPGVGDASRALKVSVTGDPIPVYIIAFVKYDVFEQLSINGTASDYDTLRQAAGTAAAKIK
jgi:hypothetical protein